MEFLAIMTLLFATATANADPNKLMQNPELFEGDIMGINVTDDRNAIPKDSQRWPNGVVVYELDTSLGSTWVEVFAGMKHIEERTCIKFVRRTDEKDYVEIFAGKGCYSYWGRVGGKQMLSVPPGCLSLGTVVHEFLHAIGFLHEQNRSDRDDYLTINWDNIEEKWKYAFRKLQPNENRLLTPFDYDSVMLYGQYSFTKQYPLKSMESKDGRFLDEAYNKPGMSASDVKRVNMLYNCKQ